MWTPPAPAAMAVRSATSAVASLNSDSPSRIVTMRRGRPIRRPIAVAATASGGATTAPIASAAHQSIPGNSACTRTPTPNVVMSTRPKLSSRMGRRFALKSTRDVEMAAAYNSGGSRPSSTMSAARWTVGTPGEYDATTPTTISPSGAGKRSRSASAVPASTTIARATSSKAISTRTFSPAPRSGRAHARSATHLIGSPQPSSSCPSRDRASTTTVRRYAANVSTWAIIPP